MDEFGTVRLTLLDETGGVIEIYDVPLDDLFEETIRAFADEAYERDAVKVMLVRFNFKGKVLGYEEIEVDEFFSRFIDRLIEEFYEDIQDEGLVKELEHYGI